MTSNEILADFRNSTRGKRSGNKGRGFVSRNTMNRSAIEDVSIKEHRFSNGWKRKGHILVRKNLIEKV